MQLRESLFDIGPPPPPPERFNIAAWVLRHAAERPDAIALRVVGTGTEELERWARGELDRAIRATAAGLRAAGLAPGDRVALRLGNTSAFPILFFGTIAAGGISVPTSAALTAREFVALAADMRPRFAAIADELALSEPLPGCEILPPAAWAALQTQAPGPIADTGANDPAFIVYTSGTGGRPKGVLHAQRSAWARQMMWAGWYGLGSDDLLLHAGAFNWTYTLGAGLTDPWAAGASTLIYAGPPGPEIWARIAARHAPTLFAAVPGVYRQILRSDRDLASDFASLRHGITAGERLPEPVAEAWTARTGAPLYEALGMSEISTYVSASPEVPRKPGRAGRPQAGRRVAILDEQGRIAPIGTPGRLAVSRRDPGLMLGLWQRPAETEAAFDGEWFLTGDRAEMDPEGYIASLGRDDEVMTALGYRVAPQEVEDALLPHPAIAEIAVAELPVRPDLALIAAFVVAHGPWPGEEALSAFAETRLARYKQPRLWIEVDRLPRTANGKLLRRDLIEAHRRDRG